MIRDLLAFLLLQAFLLLLTFFLPFLAFLLSLTFFFFLVLSSCLGPCCQDCVFVGATAVFGISVFDAIPDFARVPTAARISCCFWPCCWCSCRCDRPGSPCCCWRSCYCRRYLLLLASLRFLASQFLLTFHLVSAVSTVSCVLAISCFASVASVVNVSTVIDIPFAAKKVLPKTDLYFLFYLYTIVVKRVLLIVKLYFIMIVLCLFLGSTGTVLHPPLHAHIPTFFKSDLFQNQVPVPNRIIIKHD